MIVRAGIFLLGFLVAGCGGGGGGSSATTTTLPPAPVAAAIVTGNAFFYQDVAPTGNAVRAGFTTDGHSITSYLTSVLTWQVIVPNGPIYGDPVISRLSTGRWLMTAGTVDNDPRGANALMIQESTCPTVSQAAVRVLNRSTAATCEATGGLSMAKTSQAFNVNGSQYIFGMADAKIMLMRLTDATHSTADLTSICVRRTRAANFAALNWGEATIVIDSAQAPGLLLSDSGIARRRDGTWVLFVKGIASNVGCSGGNLCELCARAIYRSTSQDLITWTTLEKMVEPASVPDAGNSTDGTVWLYWQDFAPACAAQNLQLAARAPIRFATETSTGALSASTPITIPAETFEANTNLHYATNGNPVLLPDTAAKTAFDACFGR
jgi:hypothetical protein